MDQDVTLGEVHRLLLDVRSEVGSFRKDVSERNNALVNQVNQALGPVSVHTVQIAALEKQLGNMDAKVENVTATANKISGIGAAVAVVAGLLSGWFKHGGGG